MLGRGLKSGCGAGLVVMMVLVHGTVGSLTEGTRVALTLMRGSNVLHVLEPLVKEFEGFVSTGLDMLEVAAVRPVARSLGG